MTDASFDRTAFGAEQLNRDTLAYRALFAVVFTFSFPAIFTARAFGARVEGTVWQEARQAAHATAGYTFQR